jgi:hypothetical protein
MWKNRSQRRANHGMRFRSEGLQRENGWGALKERGETWSIWNRDGRPRLFRPSPIDGQREKTDWKRTEAGNQQSADIR